MTFSLSLLCLILISYLALLYFSAYAVERGWIPRSWVQQPITYLFSLGVYSSAWGYYGTVALADLYGFGYLAYFLGLGGAFLLTSALLRPILHITRMYQLNSLADMMAFRYRARIVGPLVTLGMIAVVVPLLSLQLKAVADTMNILSPGWPLWVLALGFALVMLLLTILFGAKEMTPRENHEGLVFALALETVFKLSAVLVTSIILFIDVIPELETLGESWTAIHGQLMDRPLSPPGGPWLTLLIMCVAIAITMPHTFHITFTENVSNRALRLASWGFPLILFLLSITIPPLLWASETMQLTGPVEYFALELGTRHSWSALPLLIFLGGVAAATGVSIQITLATATMTVNHLLFPINKPGPTQDFYGWLLWGRRGMIALILSLAFGFYSLTGDHLTLNHLGILACIVAMQFLPGVLGLLYWPGSSHMGFITGFGIGMAIWFLGILLPWSFPELAQISAIPIPDESDWHIVAILSFVVNALIFFALSLLFPPQESETDAAEACAAAARRPSMRPLVAENSNDAILALSRPLGRYMAELEVTRALKELGLPCYEDRPHELRRMRIKLEANLSELLGSTVANDVIHNFLPLQDGVELSSDIYLIEQRLEGFHDRLSGLAGELDQLRRYHRQTLERLPIGACSLAEDGEILLWNRALEELTHIDSDQVTGTLVQELPPPWNELFTRFSESDAQHEYKKRIDMDGRPRWYNLHKSPIQGFASSHQEDERTGLVILIEDQTDTQLLERELIHSERLASIGRLAAGVAHEIGNPITGIDCLAQTIRYESEDPELRDMADQIQEQTRRVSRILQSLMNFSHAGNHSTEHEEVAIRQCVEDAMQLLRLSKRSQDIHYLNECLAELHIIGDSQRLVQVFVNLLGNARDASQPGDSIRVTSESDDHQVSVYVIDQGHGIPKDVQDQIFEPFFTTKEVGTGTGLGLALVYSIVEEHYGQIHIQSPVNESGGTCVKVSLPRYLPELRTEQLS